MVSQGEARDPAHYHGLRVVVYTSDAELRTVIHIKRFSHQLAVTLVTVRPPLGRLLTRALDLPLQVGLVRRDRLLR